MDWFKRKSSQSLGACKKSLEKQATDNASAFTWIKDMPLTELEKPEVIAKVKEQHKKQIEKLKKNKQKIQQNNPFLKG